MTTELYLIHLGFIVALVYTTFKSGYKVGKKTLMNELLDEAIKNVDDRT